MFDSFNEGGEMAGYKITEDIKMESAEEVKIELKEEIKTETVEVIEIEDSKTMSSWMLF